MNEAEKAQYAVCPIEPIPWSLPWQQAVLLIMISWDNMKVLRGKEGLSSLLWYLRHLVLCTRIQKDSSTTWWQEHRPIEAYALLLCTHTGIEESHAHCRLSMLRWYWVRLGVWKIWRWRGHVMVVRMLFASVRMIPLLIMFKRCFNLDDNMLNWFEKV